MNKEQCKQCGACSIKEAEEKCNAYCDESGNIICEGESIWEDE